MADTLEDLPAISTSEDNQPLFKPQLVLDPRLDVKSSLNIAVQKSGQQVTQFVQKASSASTSGCQFEIIVPSLSTIIARDILIKSQLTFTVSGTTLAGDVLIKAGINSAPSSFAFQQCCSTISCSLNNSVITFEASEVLAEVLRVMPKDVLNEYADLTPVVMDNYATWAETMTNPGGKSAVPKRNSPLSANQSSFPYQQGRGSYNITSITPDANPTTAGVHTYEIVLDIVEPLIMSPFLLANCHKTPNGQGVYGVQNMAFNFQFQNTQFSRAFRGLFGVGFASPAINSVVLKTVDVNSSLMLTFLSPHASLKLPSRNCIDYMQLYTYKTPFPTLLENVLAPGANQKTGQSNTVVLSQIPDSIMVGVRRITANRTGAYPDTWLPISSVVVNFNNTPGILSNASQYDLYKISKKNGLDVTWNNFRGYALESPSVDNISAGAGSASTYVIDDVKAGAPIFVGTSGSPVLLKLGEDIPISQDWLSSSSIGSYSLSVSVTASDNTNFAGSGTNTDLDKYELFIIGFMSSMMVVSLGSASSYSGLLTKQQVLEASVQTPVSGASLARVYGAGGMHTLSGMPKTGGRGYSAGGKGKMESRFV